MNEILRILMIDDNPDDRLLAIRALRREFPDLQVEQISEAKGLAQALEAGDFDLVITDYQLRWSDGLAVLRAVKARYPDCPVIMFTATGSEEIAVEAMKNGLDDYVLKSPKHFIRLPAAVRLALKRAEDSIERKRAEARIEHLNLVLRAIRGVNQLIVREKDRGRLIQGACDKLIETRGYYNAWIALIDESGKLVATAEAGLGEGFLPLVEQLERGEPFYCRRMALAQAGALIIEDPVSTCADCPLSRGFRGRGGMAIRLEHSGKIYGLLVVSVSVDYVADEEEQSLFEEVAEDIAFALHSIELEEERERAQEALRQKTEQQEVLLSSIPAFVYYKDAELKLITANKAFAEMVNTPIDQLPGKDAYDLFPKEQAEKFHIDDKEVMESGKPMMNIEEKFTDAEGKTRWASTSKVPYFDEKGKVAGMVGITIDITERKRAEEEIEKLAKFPSENPNAVLRVAKDGTVIYANEAALPLLNIWGCQMDQTLPDDWRQFASDVLSSGSSEDAEVDCERRILSLTFAPVVDADYVNVYGLDITERKRAEEELRRSFEELRRSFEGTVHVLASAIEMRDPYTAGHQRRVSELACAIANEMGLPGEQIEGIRMAGLIHDIGKINVPAEILSKPTQLTEIEFGLIRVHPQVGYNVLKAVEFPWPVADIVLEHHERMDGSGYPQGLSGEEIILEARILGVTDVVEAMASHRPYRPAHGIDKALEEISENRDILYDPEVVDACLKLFTEKGFTF